MNTYELIKELERLDLLKHLIGKGVIPVRFLNDKEMFERFTELRLKNLPKMESYILIADEFKTSIDTVQRVIKKLSH